MDTVITVIQVLVAIFAGAAGLLRLATPYTKFVTLPGQTWASDFEPWHIQLIGILEVGAAIGIMVPLLSGSITLLTPLAAVGVALIMAGAMATHLRREEYPNVVGNLVWLGLALFLAYSRLVELV